MSNEYNIKNGLIVNNTQVITGITDNYNFVSNDIYTIPTANAIKGYIDSKRINSYIIYNSGGTLSGSSSLTATPNASYNPDIDLNISGGTKTISGFFSYDGAMCVRLMNKTGGVTTKGKLVTYNTNGNIPFTNAVGFSGNGVYSVNIQPDNKIICGGSFTAYNSVVRANIARLNSNGTIDTNFIIGAGFTGVSPYINVTELQSDGKIVVGGNFTTYSGTSQANITRLLSNGGIDTGFTIGSGFNGYVTAIHTQLDGKIIVGGNFTTYSGVTANYIIRLNTDGIKDTGFANTTAFNSTVNTLDIQDDGKIVVGGFFTSFSGATSYRIVRLNVDGTRDTGFTIGSFFDGVVRVVKVQPNGKILVGGAFTSYSGVTQNYITRLNVDGTRDTGFTIGTGFNSQVQSIHLQSDSKIIVGGQFTTYSGITTYKVVKLYQSGVLDSGFSPSTGFNSDIYSVYSQSDNKIICGGVFTTFSGVTQNFITRLTATGNLDNVNTYYPNSFKYYPSGVTMDTPYIGVTIENGIADGQYTYVALYGVCDIKIGTGSQSIYTGNLLSTYNSTSSGDILNSLNSGYLIGYALQNGNSGDTIKCVLYNKDLQ